MANSIPDTAPVRPASDDVYAHTTQSSAPDPHFNALDPHRVNTSNENQTREGQLADRRGTTIEAEKERLNADPHKEAGKTDAAKQQAAKQQENKQQAKQNPQPASQAKAKTQEDLEREKVEREREIMRDPHEKETKKKGSTGPNPMPSYRDHDNPSKSVAALRIKGVIPVTPTVSELHFHESGYGPVKVDAPWITAHRPKAGGWYVVDGTGRRFLDAQEFNSRYRRGVTA